MRTYWGFTRQVSLGFVLLWACTAFGSAYFAAGLTSLFFGWSLGYWLSAQGALLVFLLIVCLYARVMNRADERHRQVDPG
jgi:putative solute:sodium symporter small subunit